MQTALSDYRKSFNDYDMISTSLDFTTDDFLSPGRHNALFEESIRFASGGRAILNDLLDDSTDEPPMCESSSSFVTESLRNPSVTAVFKLAEEWKKQGEISFLISLVQASPEIIRGEKIARRLKALRQMTIEDDDGDISSDSMRSFFEFLSHHPRCNYPEITLTPDGEIYARWKGPEKSRLSIHFLFKSRVHYVLFAPDRKRPDIMDRISATASVDTVLEIADRAYEIAGWVTE